MDIEDLNQTETENLIKVLRKKWVDNMNGKYTGGLNSRDNEMRVKLDAHLMTFMEEEDG